jgi:hypothetical protein
MNFVVCIEAHRSGAPGTLHGELDVGIGGKPVHEVCIWGISGFGGWCGGDARDYLGVLEGEDQFKFSG